MICGPLPMFANDPGGGAPGVGANVTLSTTSTTATLSNGVISAVIEKSNGRITSYKLNGTQMVDTANPIYYSMDGGASYEQPSGCVYSLVSSTTDMVHIMTKRTWNANAGYKHVFDIELHYILRRGDTGLYAYAVLDHPASYPATAVGEWRIVWKLARNTPTTFMFERGYVDDDRKGEMPTYADYQNASPTSIAEIVKLNTGIWAGRYDGKYSYAVEYIKHGTFGKASNVAKKGVWFALGGFDYFNDGPTHQDLSISESYLLMHFGRNHFGGSGTNVAAGEAYRKMFGPFLLYCNATTATTNAGDALWTDAKAQAAAEQAAWPYAWLDNADHPGPAGRGTATGRFVITDPLKPSVSATGAWIGLAAPETVAGNWQQQSKGYQYWSRVDAAGDFTIRGVRPGSYTLYAFNNGVVGEYSKTDVVITAGGITNLNTLTWTIVHPGASIAWEIGTPDRTAAEFRHGNEYFKPFLWDVFPAQLPNPLVYTIGTSNPATDWNYAHTAYPTTDASGVTTLGEWKWRVDFPLAAVPSAGEATLTVAVASANYARHFLFINDETTAISRLSPRYSGGNAVFRQGIHAKYSVVDIKIPVSKLRVGANSITFSASSVDSIGYHLMYDYIRLELPAFPPPPPSSGRTLTWTGGTTAAANTWDAGTTPGFTTGGSATAFATGDAVVFDSTGSNATAVTLTGSLEPNSVTVNATKNYTFSGTGDLTGRMGLTKSGSGRLTLSSANTYSGPTVVSGGTLGFGNDAANATALGTGPVTLNGGTLAMFYSSTNVSVTAPWNIEVPSGATATFAPAWRSALNGKLTGGGTLNYTLPNGAIRAGIFGDWTGFTGRVNATTTGTADFRMALDYSWAGLPNGALNLGPGVTAYYAGNLNSGAGTTVAFGELSGAATASLKGGAVGGRRINYRIGGLNTDATFAGTLAEQANGLTNLVKTGSGVWTLSGLGTLAGTARVEGGTLLVGSSLTLGAAAVVDVASGGTLRVGGTLTAATVQIADGGTYVGAGTLNAALVNDGQSLCTGGTFRVNGAVTNNGNLRLTGGAVLAVSGGFINNGVLDLIDANPTLPAGFVNNGIVLTARAPATLVWAGVVEPLWGNQQTANWLNGASPDVFRPGDTVVFDDTSTEASIELVGSLAPAAVTVNTASAFTFGGTGAISGPASLTKTGAGLLSFATAQPLSGLVSVNAGTLQLGLAAAFSSAAGFAVSSGATLDAGGLTGGFGVAAGQTLGGAGTVAGATTVLGTLAPGDAGAGTLTFTGNLTLGVGSAIVYELGTVSDRVTVGGNLTLGGSLTVVPRTGFGPGTYTLFTSAGAVQLAPGGVIFSSPPAGYTLTLGTTPQGSVNLVVAFAATPYAQWQTQWFGASPGPSAATGADPDGDGENNLYEFATGQSPLATTSAAPTLAIASGGASLDFTYSRGLSALAAGYGFTVERSDTLVVDSWVPAGASEMVLSTDSVRQTVRATVPMDAATRRFLRLRVTTPAL
jgi:rhamnogalacturonan endolyase